jgi:hypothetical protein
MVKDGEGPFLSRCKGVEYLSGLSRLRRFWWTSHLVLILLQVER